MSAILKVCGFLFNFLLNSTLVVFYWRGTWVLCDISTIQVTAEQNAWLSFAIGNLIVLILSFAKKPNLHNECILSVIFHIYIYTLGFGCVAQWRGVWYLTDYYSGKTTLGASISLLSGACIMIPLRCFKSVISPPVVRDELDIHRSFAVHNRFTTKVS